VSDHGGAGGRIEQLYTQHPFIVEHDWPMAGLTSSMAPYLTASNGRVYSLMSSIQRSSGMCNLQKWVKQIVFMTRISTPGFVALPDFRGSLLVCGFWLLLALTPTPWCVAAEPGTAAVAAYNAYVAGLEMRLTEQHRSPSRFLVLAGPAGQIEPRLLRGELIVEKVTPASGVDLPGAMLYHWRGTAFVSGAKAADFERLMRDFSAYPRNFSPQVVQAKVISQQGDRFEATIRVRQKHVITVVMDTTYDIVFGRLDAQHGYSISRSTRIAEIEAAGTSGERALSPSEEHGFLWRLNNYWSYEERDGGLYMQIESVSLTRSIPTGLGWVIGPFVESVPRESLEFTLRSVCNALRR
jgi:hypothetical protein